MEGVGSTCGSATPGCGGGQPDSTTVFPIPIPSRSILFFSFEFERLTEWRRRSGRSLAEALRRYFEPPRFVQRTLSVSLRIQLSYFF